MILTSAHILDLIEGLPANVAFDYVSGGDSKAKLVSIDRKSVKVDIVRINADGSEKNASMTTDILNTLANSIKENKPFKFDNVLNGSGNVRSTMEAIFAHTSEFYSCKIGRVKHLIWVPRIPHEIGKIVDYDSIKDKMSDILSNDSIALNQPLQQIFFGAPGTGKSNKIKEEVDDFGKIHFRTTFHPDSDYSTFVGCYKPKSHKKNMLNGNGINETQLLSSFFDSNSPKYNRMNKARYLYEALVHTKDIRDLGLDAQMVADKLNAKGFTGCAYTTEATCMYNIYDWLKEDGYIVENKVTYEFTPQAFLKAYTEAWKHQETGDPVYLIIEEINRGNCAQIFGDIFQLLDRDEQGFSRYEISPDSDIQDYIGSLGLSISGIVNSEGKDISAEIASGEILKLPDNLRIWATMNTSDQSLFPIDSAFKRRWDWKYIKIKNHPECNYQINIGDEEHDWWQFITKINEIIASMTSSADKQLGYFFCKADKDGKISAETFVSKVIFYLWNDVFKDYGFEDASLFRYTDKDGAEKDLTFPDFYDEDGEKVDTERLADFLKKVMEWKKADEKND
jgi:hypothetical protein